MRRTSRGISRHLCQPDVFQPIALLVYRNDGNSHFTEVAKKLGLDKPAKALGIAIADYDRDRRIDLKRIHVRGRSKGAFWARN